MGRISCGPGQLSCLRPIVTHQEHKLCVQSAPESCSSHPRIALEAFAEAEGRWRWQGDRCARRALPSTLARPRRPSPGSALRTCQRTQPATLHASMQLRLRATVMVTSLANVESERSEAGSGWRGIQRQPGRSRAVSLANVRLTTLQNSVSVSERGLKPAVLPRLAEHEGRAARHAAVGVSNETRRERRERQTRNRDRVVE